MPLRDNLTVNLSSGAYVNVTLSIHARKVVLYEDPDNGAAAGLQYTLPDDNFVAVHKLDVGDKLTLGDTVAHNNNEGPIVGTPGYNSGGQTIAATVVAKLLSQGAATKYKIEETA